MPSDAIAAISTDQAHVDAANQRLAAALAADRTSSDTSPSEAEQAHAAVASAEAALAAAEATLRADQAAPTQPDPNSTASTTSSGSQHLVEIVV